MLAAICPALGLVSVVLSRLGLEVGYSLANSLRQIVMVRPEVAGNADRSHNVCV
jgi:hypothetical protein